MVKKIHISPENSHYKIKRAVKNTRVVSILIKTLADTSIGLTLLVKSYHRVGLLVKNYHRERKGKQLQSCQN